jgi:hypothetical protein
LKGKLEVEAEEYVQARTMSGGVEVSMPEPPKQIIIIIINQT